MGSAKTAHIISLCIALSACYGARPIGSLNSEPLSWDFIQSVGGIRLGDPYSLNGRRMVPVIVDVTGSQTITVTPTLTNSELVCSGVIVSGRGEGGEDFNMKITVFAEPKSVANTSVGVRTGECEDLSLPPRNNIFGRSGAYNIYYVDNPGSFPAINQVEHYLGTVR